MDRCIAPIQTNYCIALIKKDSKMISENTVRIHAKIIEVSGAEDGGTTSSERPLIVGTAAPFATVDVFDSATLLGVASANGQGGWALQLSSALFDGVHDLSAVQMVDHGERGEIHYFTVNVQSVDDSEFKESVALLESAPVISEDGRPFFPKNLFTVRTASASLKHDDAPVPEAHAVAPVSAGAAPHASAGSPQKAARHSGLSACAPPYAMRTSDISERGRSFETIAFLGHHQVLDADKLTHVSSVARLDIGGFDLGGHHNALRLSPENLLALGANNLFLDDGKLQLMVSGKEGDSVDLIRSRNGDDSGHEWERHGTAQFGGHTFNVIEHASGRAELWVEQAVTIGLQ
jgi:hypothetical protein